VRTSWWMELLRRRRRDQPGDIGFIGSESAQDLLHVINAGAAEGTIDHQTDAAVVPQCQRSGPRGRG